MVDHEAGGVAQAVRAEPGAVARRAPPRGGRRPGRRRRRPRARPCPAGGGARRPPVRAVVAAAARKSRAPGGPSSSRRCEGLCLEKARPRSPAVAACGDLVDVGRRDVKEGDLGTRQEGAGGRRRRTPPGALDHPDDGLHGCIIPPISTTPTGPGWRRAARAVPSRRPDGGTRRWAAPRLAGAGLASRAGWPASRRR